MLLDSNAEKVMNLVVMIDNLSKRFIFNFINYVYRVFFLSFFYYN